MSKYQEALNKVLDGTGYISDVDLLQKLVHKETQMENIKQNVIEEFERVKLFGGLTEGRIWYLAGIKFCLDLLNRLEDK